MRECDWNGRSEKGAEFICAAPLSLEEGRTAELIVIGQEKPKVVFRVSHAVMDGIGVLHFLQELFRALRGEPLLGTNATYTDTVLKLRVQSELNWRKGSMFSLQTGAQSAFMTGGVQGTERGGTWRRLSIAGPQPNLRARIISILVEFSRLNSDGHIRIAIPSNLRRHAPQLLSTMNFTGMTYFELEPGKEANPDDIKAYLKDIQDKNVDVNYTRLFELGRYLPFSWIDRMASVNEKNYTAPAIHESAVLTVLGAFPKDLYSCDGFSAQRIYMLPFLENVFLTVTGFHGQYEICVGMPRVFASNGRMDAFIAFLEKRLKPTQKSE